MKTKPLLLLLALIFSATPLRADDLCGGADDDQKSGFPAETTANAAMRPKWAPLCGGMDDDQFRLLPVLQGLVTDPLGLPPPPSGARPQAPAIARLDQLDEASIIAILIGQLNGDEGADVDSIIAILIGNLHGDDDSDTLAEFDAMTSLMMAPPVLRGIESDPFGARAGMSAPHGPTGICGGNGNDSITGDGGDDFRPSGSRIVGGDGADFLRDPFVRGLIYGETGSDSLWGGGGTDEIVADDTVDWYR